VNNQNVVHTAESVRPSLRGIQLYHWADALTGGLICFMLVFSPWAFGATQRWSIWVMNVFGYALGLLLLTKLYVRFHLGYQPARWGGHSSRNSSTGRDTAGRFLVIALAVMTVLILGYCLVSALNARATYQTKDGGFVYHECIPWLPHSYDSSSTWHYFWDYLALAFSFWAARDWLLGYTTAEVRAQRRLEPSALSLQPSVSRIPQRLRRLLWILSLNGALLAMEGICQRVSGTNRLLWLMPTNRNQAALYQFGPYAYRANGAQYLNLVWPSSLALWWVLHRAARRRHHPLAGFSGWKHNLLLPCVLVMAAGPIISTSRGGAIVAISMIVAAAFMLLFAMRRRHPLIRFGMALFFAAAFALGAYLGGDKLMERMDRFGADLSGREQMYETARGMARDYPLFGVGPGACAFMFQLYRTSLTEYWPAQLHNDWLETRITFGWVGSAMIGLAFLVALMQSFARGGISGITGAWQFVLLFWMALAGCLVHARFDFPLQIYSILFLFLLLCAILSTLSLRSRNDEPRIPSLRTVSAP